MPPSVRVVLVKLFYVLIYYLEIWIIYILNKGCTNQENIQRLHLNLLYYSFIICIYSLYKLSLLLVIRPFYHFLTSNRLCLTRPKATKLKVTERNTHPWIDYVRRVTTRMKITNCIHKCHPAEQTQIKPKFVKTE